MKFGKPTRWNSQRRNWTPPTGNGSVDVSRLLTAAPQLPLINNAKGGLNGFCNRTACQASLLGTPQFVMHNNGGAHYCSGCERAFTATDIRYGDEPRCTPVEEPIEPKLHESIARMIGMPEGECHQGWIALISFVHGDRVVRNMVVAKIDDPMFRIKNPDADSESVSDFTEYARAKANFTRLQDMLREMGLSPVCKHQVIKVK